MTLVLCGLTYKFLRLAELAEYAYEEGALSLPVIIQGQGLKERASRQGLSEKYPHIQYIDSVSRQEYAKLLKDADFVVTHAGVGSILGAKTAGHPFVIVPRVHSLGEHVNDHQIDTLRGFESEGYLSGLAYASHYPQQSKEEFVAHIVQLQSLPASTIAHRTQSTHLSLIERILDQEKRASMKDLLTTGQGLMLSASAGGHMVELMYAMGYAQRDQRAEHVKDRAQSESHKSACDLPRIDTLVSTMPLGEGDLPAKSQELLLEGNRHNPIRMCGNIIRAIGIIRKHRPRLLVTTGALPSAILARIAVLCGVHVIWIDSISAVHKLTLSGRWVKRFARVYVQWKQLADDEQTFYCGSLFD